ncbi:MAG: translation initiation factor IF-3 [Syntrophomonadaceae bacterium]|nr:translation initiation factor IF-3 [Syntrophomonadaceae bacterium]
MHQAGSSARLIFSGGEFLISKDWRVNEEIRVREVRLIDDNGEQIGIVPVREALQRAYEKNLDLVEVAPGARPPVCRLMDFGKFRYEQSKRDKEARKKQKIITIKEVKMRPKIDNHDFLVKAKNAKRFLENGDKVKVTIMFRGREISHAQLGQQLCIRLAEELSSVGAIEREPKVEGRNMIMILTPRSDNANLKLKEDI